MTNSQKNTRQVPLRTKAASGARWTSAATALAGGIQFVQTAIVARFLTPEDFGLVAMIGVALGLARAVAEAGIAEGLITYPNATHDQKSSMYWFNLMLAILVGLILWASTPLVVTFYQEPQLKSLLVWAAVCVPASALGQQYRALLQKDLRFERFAVVTAAAFAIGAAVSIIFAICGYGAYALMWGQVASALSGSLMFIIAGIKSWRPSLHFRLSDLDGYLNFGVYQMAGRAVNFLSANVDYAIAGRFLGPGPLGMYRLAYELAIKPMSKINPVINKVAYPVFARAQRDDAVLRRGYLEILRLLGTLGFPLLCGLGVVAPVFIPVVFGSGWYESIALTQILVLLGIIKLQGNPSGSVLLAKGRSDINFGWSLLRTVVNTVVFLMIIRLGIYALAWTEVGLSLLFAVGLWYILDRLIGLPLHDYLASMAKPMAFSLIMAVVVFLVLQLIDGSSLKPLFILSSSVLVGGICYISLYLLLDNEYVKSLWRDFMPASKELT